MVLQYKINELSKTFCLVYMIIAACMISTIVLLCLGVEMKHQSDFLNDFGPEVQCLDGTDTNGALTGVKQFSIKDGGSEHIVREYGNVNWDNATTHAKYSETGKWADGVKGINIVGTDANGGDVVKTTADTAKMNEVREFNNIRLGLGLDGDADLKAHGIKYNNDGWSGNFKDVMKRMVDDKMAMYDGIGGLIGVVGAGAHFCASKKLDNAINESLEMAAKKQENKEIEKTQKPQLLNGESSHSDTSDTHEVQADFHVNKSGPVQRSDNFDDWFENHGGSTKTHLLQFSLGATILFLVGIVVSFCFFLIPGTIAQHNVMMLPLILACVFGVGTFGTMHFEHKEHMKEHYRDTMAQKTEYYKKYNNGRKEASNSNSNGPADEKKNTSTSNSNPIEISVAVAGENQREDPMKRLRKAEARANAADERAARLEKELADQKKQREQDKKENEKQREQDKKENEAFRKEMMAIINARSSLNAGDSESISESSRSNTTSISQTVTDPLNLQIKPCLTNIPTITSSLTSKIRAKHSNHL